mmetsp:Transcript_18724/g.38052  ORF Transcript_18724/g.38052 Transcript_18724/m.38052 type:complete len:325 (-) Transcript_18724:73-1047(-)
MKTPRKKPNEKNCSKKKKGINKIWFPKKILIGHSGRITCLSSSFLHNLLASGSTDGSIRFWSYDSFHPIICFPGKIGGINCISFDKKIGNFFSGGEEMEIKCWDMEKQKVSRKFKGHFSSITDLAIHPLLNILVSGGRDCTIRIWDMRVKKAIKILDFHSKSISSILINEESPHLITSSLDRTICLWDFVLDNIIGRLSSHTQGIKIMRKNPAEFTFTSLSSDSLVKWRSDGSLIKRFPDSSNSNYSLAFSKKEGMVSSTTSGWVNFLDDCKPNKYSRFTLSMKIPIFFSKNISSLHFNPKGDLMLFGKEEKHIEVFQKKWKNV